MAATITEGAFSLRPFGQTDPEEDYRLLQTLSNYQVPQDPAGNQQWLSNRRRYDDTKGGRRHYIALHTPTQEPVGYASLEQQETAAYFRMYLVFNPNRWAYAELGEFMYRQLLRDAQEMEAKVL